ncbi:MAG: acyl-CoA dehydratase activase-related protein [Clostridia bacterium]|nr:acyl-CoA dehydratase activase-related protein [Clostridia bacterium]
MKLRIGIPRSLAYFVFFPFWKTFFRSLDMEVVISPATSKGVLDSGVKEAVADACVPIKLFHGHVLELKEQVDYIFLPRLVSINKEDTVTFCPKFLGLPDLIRATLPNLPPLIDEKVDLQKGPWEIYRLCVRIGRVLGKSPWASLLACRKGRAAQQQYEKIIWQLKVTPAEALQMVEKYQVLPPAAEEEYQLSFAVLGFPYTINDRFISVDMVKKLRQLGVRVLTAEMVPRQNLLAQARKLPKNLFWHFSNQVMRAAMYFMDEKVDGIIHVTAFGCGPDAMVNKMIELEAKARGKIPFMNITIDEHTGEAGVLTRLEAFVDMLKLRRGMI